MSIKNLLFIVVLLVNVGAVLGADDAPPSYEALFGEAAPAFLPPTAEGYVPKADRASLQAYYSVPGNSAFVAFSLRGDESKFILPVEPGVTTVGDIKRDIARRAMIDLPAVKVEKVYASSDYPNLADSKVLFAAEEYKREDVPRMTSLDFYDEEGHGLGDALSDKRRGDVIRLASGPVEMPGYRGSYFEVPWAQHTLVGKADYPYLIAIDYAQLDADARRRVEQAAVDSTIVPVGSPVTRKSDNKIGIVRSIERPTVIGDDARKARELTAYVVDFGGATERVALDNAKHVRPHYVLAFPKAEFAQYEY